jgi:hypothetical protein
MTPNLKTEEDVPNFKVQITDTTVDVYEVEADDEAQALEIAEDYHVEGGQAPIYSYSPEREVKIHRRGSV